MRLLLSGLAACTLLQADFAADAWRYRRSLTLSQPGPIAEFTVDPTLYHSSSNLDDLRILRDNTETPYVIVPLAGSHQTYERPVTIVNKVWVPNTGVQAVLDLRSNIEHNRLRIVTPLHNFKETVRVETSDDARTWAVAESAGLIFDVRHEDHTRAEDDVFYPLSNRRFVRLTIPGWTEPANLRSVWVSHLKETGATRDIVDGLTPSVREDTKEQLTELTLDLGFQGQPYDRIDLSVEPGYFSRSTEVASSSDRNHWNVADTGVITRTADAEHLSLATRERTDRYLKITVFNRDNAPLHFGQVTLRGIRRVVKFPSAKAGPYAVYVGNVGARQPSYDFGRVLPSQTSSAAATLGALEPNPQFRPAERPWTDRNPWLLNSVLIAVVVIMGFVSLRMLHNAKAS